MTKEKAKELLEALEELVNDIAIGAAERECGDYETPSDLPAIRDRLLKLLESMHAG